LTPKFTEPKIKPKKEENIMKEITGFESSDVQQNKIIAALGYVLFLIPLLAAPQSKFAKFHTNQGLLFNLVELVGFVVLPFIPLIGGMLNGLFNLAAFIAMVALIVVTAGGKAYELPVIGNIQLIK